MSRMARSKKVLVVLFSLVFIFALLSNTVFATDNLNTANSIIKNGKLME